MKIVKFNNAEKFVRGNNCEVLEYPLNDPDINVGTAKITGRFPDTRILCK